MVLNLLPRHTEKFVIDACDFDFDLMTLVLKLDLCERLKSQIE